MWIVNDYSRSDPRLKDFAKDAHKYSIDPDEAYYVYESTSVHLGTVAFGVFAYTGEAMDELYALYSNLVS